MLNRIRPKEIRDISSKAVLIVSYNGMECIIPKSQLYFGMGEYWVPNWLVVKKEIQYSPTSTAMLSKCGDVYVSNIKTHVPKKIKYLQSKIDKELLR